MHPRRNPLAGDQRGAVMVMGLFMSIFLIGALWSILGIGEAIVVRDKAIEAADHGAFSAAAVHARGMNYIAALNLIMFILTIIYVAMCTVINIILVVAKLGGWAKYKLFWIGPDKCWPSGSVAGVVPQISSIAKKACDVGHKLAKNLAEPYNNNVLIPVFKGVSAIQKVIQVGMPVAAEAAGFTVSSRYTPYHGMVLQPSLVPGISKSSTKIGLPLKNIKYSFMCKRAFSELEDKVQDFLPGPIAAVFKWVLGKFEDKLMSLPPKDTDGGFGFPIGGKSGGIGCRDHGGDHPWGDLGLPVVADGVENGSDYLQMWGIIIDAQDKDATQSERRVGMSASKGRTGATQPAQKRIYYSQAEYYFDCTSNWTGKDCNQKDTLDASFTIAWKARLRRVWAPSFDSKVMGLLTDFALAGSLDNFIAGKVGGTGAGQKVADMLAKFRNAADVPGLGNMNQTVDPALNFFNGGDRPIH